ncbi:adenylate kinase family protein [Streptomyces venezuelae]|uniref:adenylate kinase family protein n=1 Tax=Streptomyces venezuelae TaxID=54571 RepID=UPI00278C5B76|nr:nucleoside monophosphate kinase [Streptomyces venezuelae]
MLREASTSGTPSGLERKKTLEANQQVSDALIASLIKERLSRPDAENGYVMHGTPRTVTQAEVFEAAGLHFDAVIEVYTTERNIIDERAGRRLCPEDGTVFHIAKNKPRIPDLCDTCGGKLIQRDEDAVETVQHRISLYRTQTKPILDFYEKLSEQNSGNPFVRYVSTPDRDEMNVCRKAAAQL